MSSSPEGPGLQQLLLQLQPKELEESFWKDAAVQSTYMQTDQWAFYFTTGNIVVGWFLCDGFANWRTRAALKAACVVIFASTLLQRRLLNQPAQSWLYDRLAGANRLMRGVWMLAFFRNMTPADGIAYYIQPRLDNGMPPAAVLAMSICAYCIVHGMQTLTYRIRFSRIIWIHAGLLICAWPLLRSLRGSLLHPGLQAPAVSGCRVMQDVLLLLRSWAAQPLLGMYHEDAQVCQQQPTDLLLAFAICFLGMMLPAYVCYCREGILKADFLKAATRGRVQVLTWLRQPLSHVVLVPVLLLMAHTMAELILAAEKGSRQHTQ